MKARGFPWAPSLQLVTKAASKTASGSASARAGRYAGTEARSTMNVPFLDLRAAYRELQEELDEAYRHCMSAGSYVLGPEGEAFEREFARYCGCDHCIGVGNGLEALSLILRAYRVGSGDEVIVPSHTFIATWLAVSQVGANPVPV